MSKDINNIDTYETRTKVNTKKWSPIHELIEEAYIKDSKIFSDGFIKNVWIIQTKYMIYHAR